MAGIITNKSSKSQDIRPPHISEPKYIKWIFIILSILFLCSIILMPLIIVIVESLRKGLVVYFEALSDPYTMSALKLTLFIAAIAVPLNTLFGIAASWAITKFQFKGKNMLISLIEMPFAVSPVIAGMIFVLLLGANSTIGYWLEEREIFIIFATPGMVLATMFVTFPFVARELIPLMQAQGIQEEEAAASLGASGWKIFWKVTFPNIKWGLLYGMILCNARAIGEFGAVAVVSSQIQGESNTLPLEVHTLNESTGETAVTAAFAVASLLVLIALITIAVKSFIEWKEHKQKSQLEQEV